MSEGNEPRILTCEECGEEFVLTAEAQEYLAERGKPEDPRWCRSCYVAQRKQFRERQAARQGHVKS